MALFRISFDSKELRQIHIYNILFKSSLFHCADALEQNADSICELQDSQRALFRISFDPK